MKYEVITLNLADITVDQRVQPRDDLYTHRIDELADCYREQVDVPPIKVHEVDGKMYACDGFHRYAGACKAGLRTLSCRVRRGSTWGALVVDAIKSNAKHGQPLTQNEKRRAARTLIDLFKEDEQQWTQQDVAELTGCSQSTISRIVKEMTGSTKPVINPEAPKERTLSPTAQLASKIIEDEQEDEVEEDHVAEDIEAMIAEAKDRCRSIYQAARKISEWLHELKDMEGGQEVAANMPMFEQAKRDLMTIQSVTPRGVCPHCEGHKCRRCMQRGWVTEGRFKAIK